MKLRNYETTDSATICSWIKDEKSLYKWSADRIGIFPLNKESLNENYAPVLGSDTFIPLCFCDDTDKLIGHLFIRYPDDKNKHLVRFGFVIVDNERRGQGYGRKMLEMAIQYAKDILNASTITLGVFTNNENARKCYESVGFCSISQTETYKMPIGEWECTEMELKL